MARLTPRQLPADVFTFPLGPLSNTAIKELRANCYGELHWERFHDGFDEALWQRKLIVIDQEIQRRKDAFTWG